MPVACHQHLRVKKSGALEGSNLKAQLPKADVALLDQIPCQSVLLLMS